MNALILRLKNSIDQKVLARIDKDLMGQYHFVPISVKDNFLFVAVSKNSNKDEINNILKKEYSHSIKFMLVGEDDLGELLISLFPDAKMAKTPVGAPKDAGSENKQMVEVIKKHAGRLGEILLEKKIVSEVDLMKALAAAKRSGTPIGSQLHSMGLVTLEQLKEVLHEQTGFEMVSADQLSEQGKFVNILPEDFIRANSVIPISSDGKTLVLGVVKPIKMDVLKEIIYLTGLSPKQILMTHYEFQTSLNTFFSAQKKQTDEIIEQIKTETLDAAEEATLWEQVDAELQDSTGSVAKFVNQIITNAIDNKVSDIHIEPRLNGYIVRYRKDGMLQKVLDVPAKVETSIIARFKVMSRMNIAEQRRPQDGTFSIAYKECSYDFRINTLPVAGKEKVCIRILAPAVSLSANDKEIRLVGANDLDIQKVKQMVSCPNGIILTSGPTGSGKTTTLYSVLKSLNDESVNITTIEDPIEIRLEGINQSQINAKAGITFASCMRAILRQDPDIILVGEIRDYETLEIAISAALTGHLVLSTVHTNSAAATVTRLIEMGAKDYLVSSTLSGVIAQRLVRRLCDDCKEEYYPTKEEARMVTTDPDEIERIIKTPVYRAKGCNKCGFQGYKGRLGVYEIMQITKEIKKLIAQGAHDLEIEESAVANGMTTLHRSCLGHIMKGYTTIDEFVRVLGMAGE
ncbi:MAG: type II/IV secretion system protein [Cyanobacteria bacterium SIG26]|nr:type II/IV secretion system protein [Cyanobacteria bacterium SIG26]